MASHRFVPVIEQQTKIRSASLRSPSFVCTRLKEAKTTVNFDSCSRSDPVRSFPQSTSQPINPCINTPQQPQILRRIVRFRFSLLLLALVEVKVRSIATSRILVVDSTALRLLLLIARNSQAQASHSQPSQSRTQSISSV